VDTLQRVAAALQTQLMSLIAGASVWFYNATEGGAAELEPPFTRIAGLLTLAMVLMSGSAHVGYDCC
jgi:hypothetical protein